MTPCQLNRPIIILKHCISIFLSMKFHLNVVPADKWLNTLDTFYLFIYIIFSHTKWTSHNLPKPYWSSTKDHLSSTKLTGKTPSLKCSQSPAIIKDIDEYQPCRHIDAFAVISLNPLWLTQARGHFRQVVWLRTAHSAEMCAQKKKYLLIAEKN